MPLAALSSRSCILRQPHRLQPSRHTHRVAIGATRRDYLAARDWIPRRVRPFNPRAICHLSPSVDGLLS
jgi:hypothetical protein